MWILAEDEDADAEKPLKKLPFLPSQRRRLEARRQRGWMGRCRSRSITRRYPSPSLCSRPQWLPADRRHEDAEPKEWPTSPPSSAEDQLGFELNLDPAALVVDRQGLGLTDFDLHNNTASGSLAPPPASARTRRRSTLAFGRRVQPTATLLQPLLPVVSSQSRAATRETPSRPAAPACSQRRRNHRPCNAPPLPEVESSSLGEDRGEDADDLLPPFRNAAAINQSYSDRRFRIPSVASPITIVRMPPLSIPPASS